MYLQPKKQEIARYVCGARRRPHQVSSNCLFGAIAVETLHIPTYARIYQIAYLFVACCKSMREVTSLGCRNIDVPSQLSYIGKQLSPSQIESKEESRYQISNDVARIIRNLSSREAFLYQ